MAKKKKKNFQPQSSPQQLPNQGKQAVGIQQVDALLLKNLAQKAYLNQENLPLKGKHEGWNDFVDHLDETGSLLEETQSMLSQPLHWDYLKHHKLKLEDAFNYFTKHSVKKMFDADTQKIITQAFIAHIDQKAQQELGGIYPQFQSIIASHNCSKLSDLENALLDAKLQLGFSDEQEQKFQELSVSNTDLLKSSVTQGYVPKYHDVDGHLYDAMPTHFKGFLNNVVKLQTADRLKNHAEFVKAGMEEIKKIFTLPSFGDLLKGFPSDDDTLRSVVPDFDQQIEVLGSDGDMIQQFKLRCFIKSITVQDPELGNVLEGLHNNERNASKISSSDKKILFQRLKNHKLNDPHLEKIQEFLQITPDQFKEYINQLFDPEKKTVTIPLKGKKIELMFHSKDFLGKNQKMESINDLKTSEIMMNMKLDGAHKELYQTFLNPSKNEFFARGDQQLHPSYKIKVTDTQGRSHEGYPYLRRNEKDNTSELLLTEQPYRLSENPQEILTISQDEIHQYTPEVISKNFDLNNTDLEALMALSAAGAGTHQLTDKELQKNLEEYQQKKSEELGKELNKSLIPAEKKNLNPEQKEVELQEFDKRWNQISGEKVACEAGVELMMSLPKEELDFDANRKGNPHPYMTFKIIKADRSKQSLEVEYKTPWASGKTKKTFPMSAEFLDILEGGMTKQGDKIFTGQIFKFSGKDKKSFIQAIQGGKFSFEDTQKSIKDFATYLSNEVDLETMKKKHATDEKGDLKIQYFGKIGQDFDEKEKKIVEIPLMYKVEMNGDHVKLTHTDKNTSFTLSYHDFLLFAGEQGLRGYTAHEAQSFDKRFNQNQPGPIFGGTPWKWFSIGNLVAGWKKVTGNIKEYFDKKDKDKEKEFINRLLSSKLVGGLSWLPFGYGDAFKDMADDYLTLIDLDIQKEITEHQKSFKKENMSGGAALTAVWEFIEDEKKCREKPRKVAGALFYMMENGGIYQKKFAGKRGLWVNRLLGKAYEDKFHQYYATLEAEARALPGNKKELNDKLKRAEVEFIIAMLNGEGVKINDVEIFKIQGQESWKYQFGTKMVGDLTVKMNQMMHSKSTLQKAKDDMSAFPSFFLRYNEFRNALTGFQKNNILAGVELMAEKIDTDAQYYQWGGCMLGCLVTPALMSTADGTVDTGAFKAVAGNYKFMLGNFADDINAPEKVTKLLDIISRKAGIPIFSQQFKKPLADAGAVSDNFLQIEKRWTANGPRVMEYLNLKNMGEENNLVNLRSSPDSDLTVDEKNLVRQYLDLIEKDEFDMTIDPVGERANYSQGIWMMNESFISSMRYGNKNDFPGNSAQSKKNRKLWDAMSKSVQSLKNAKATPESFNFILKTYWKWFNSKYDNKAKTVFGLLLKDIKNDKATKNDIKLGFSSAIKQFKPNSTPPSSVMRTFESFEEFFWNNREYFKTINSDKVFNDDSSYIQSVMQSSSSLEEYVAKDNNLKKFIGNDMSDITEDNEEAIRSIFENMYG